MAVLPFIAQFPVSTVNFVQTLQPHIGQNTPRSKFMPPSKPTQAKIIAFIKTLDAYDKAPSVVLMTQLNDLMISLKITAIRLQESPSDCVIFYAIKDGDKNSPYLCGAVLTYRFGVPNTCFVFDPHSGQDGTIHSATQQFMNGAKLILSNLFNPNVANNPDYKHGPIGPGNIKRYADPSHSNTTAFVPFVETLYELYPNACGTITHGMNGAPNFQLLICNDYNAKFLQNGNNSWCTLLTIALAIQQTNANKASLPVDPNLVVVASPIPGYIKNNNIKVPLVSTDNRNSPIRRLKGTPLNTDVIGHMANGVTGNIFTRGSQTDHLMHCEFAPHFRKGDSHLMQIFVKAQAMAIDWYSKYDAAIQDPWQLAARFPDVYNDMSLYPKLFEPPFIVAFKAHGTNPFKGSASASLVDDSVMAASYDADIATDIMIDDDVIEPIEIDTTIIV